MVPVALVILAVAVATGQHLRAEERRAHASDAAAVSDGQRDGLDRAHAHLDAGRLDEAFEWYTSLLAADPGDAEALGHLGWTMALMGNADTGLGLIQQSLSLDEDPEVRWMRDTLVSGTFAPPPTGTPELIDHLDAHRQQTRSDTTDRVTNEETTR